jgi:hypothetical protein
MKTEKRNITFLILLFFILGFALRLTFLQTCKVIETDGVKYINLAKNIFTRNILQIHHGLPRAIFPFLIRMFHGVISNWELAGRMVSLVFGSFIPPLVFAITMQLYNYKVAIFSATLLILEPSLVSASCQVMSESVYIILILLFLYLAMQAIRNKKKFYFLSAGLILGIAYWTRPEAVFYFMFILFIILPFILLGWKVYLKKKIGFVISFILGFVFLGGLYHLYIYYLSNGWIINQDFLDTLGEYKKLSLSNTFPSIVKTYFRNLYYHVYLQHIPNLFSPLLIMIMALGFFSQTRVTGLAAEQTLLLSYVIFSLFFNTIVPWVEIRYFVSILPILFIWVGNGVYELGDWFLRNFDSARKDLVYFCVLALVIINFLPRLTGPFRQKDKFLDQAIEMKEVGSWIKDNLPQGVLIMTRWPELAFYAEKSFVMISNNKYTDLIQYAQDRYVDYIVIDRRSATKLYPEFNFLLNETDIPSELELVYIWDKRPEYKVIIYKLWR